MLAGVEHLLAVKPAQPLPRAARVDYFQIRRTRSEVGYTFWVLRGFGKYRGFTLFDTWQEAIDDAGRRISAPDGGIERALAEFEERANPGGRVAKNSDFLALIERPRAIVYR